MPADIEVWMVMVFKVLVDEGKTFGVGNPIHPVGPIVVLVEDPPNLFLFQVVDRFLLKSRGPSKPDAGEPRRGRLVQQVIPGRVGREGEKEVPRSHLPLKLGQRLLIGKGDKVVVGLVDRKIPVPSSP